MKILNSSGNEMKFDDVKNLPPVAAARDALGEVTLPSAPMAMRDSRPSLLVETDVNAHLKPRVLSHVGRMRAWDLRKLDPSMAARFSSALSGLGDAFFQLEDILLLLVQAGFVARTTPTTRLAAKLSVGDKVDLREDQRAIFASVYSEEQLATLTVARVTDTHVQLQAADGSNLGLVKLIHVVTK